MATLYSKATGNWTTLGTFNTLANGSGTDTAPTNADDCIIQNTHTVTIDATTPVCKSCTVQAGGKLKASTTASSKLVCQDTIYRSGSGIFEFDVSGDATITSTLLVNNANNALGTATQIDLAPATAPVVHVAPAEVRVENKVTVEQQPVEVNVNLPVRRSESNIERNVAQVERDA